MKGNSDGLAVDTYLERDNRTAEPVPKRSGILLVATSTALMGDGVISIKCSDRVRRLAEILGVLTARAVEIRLAQLDCRSGEVVDTFHVAETSLPADESERERLADDIRNAIVG